MIIQGIMGNDFGKNSWKKIIGILASYFAVMFFLFNISGIVLGKFLLMNIISIFMPGVAILSWLNIMQSPIEVFCTSYILGYAIVVLEYFVVMISSQNINYAMITFVVTIISLLAISCKYKNQGNVLMISKTGMEGIEICLLFFMIIINVSVYSANHLGVDVASVFTASRDIQYWTNNTVALKLAWPPTNLFMTGTPLTYHYFSNIPIAFFSSLYGIDIFTLSFPLYSLTKAIVMMGAVQFLCNTLKLDIKWTIIAYLLLLLSTGYEQFSIVTLYHHLLSAPFGFDMGYAYAIMFVAFLLKQWCEYNFDYRLWFGSLLVWSMTVGSKAPVAAVIMVFVGYICFYWLYKKKFLLAFGYGLPILFIFWLIGKYCVGMFATMQGDSAWSLSLYGLDDHSFMHSNKVIMFTDIFGTVGKVLILAMWVFLRTCMLNFPIVIGGAMACVLTVRLAKGKFISFEEINFRLALLVSAFVGIGLWHFVNAGGSSEMYFAMTSLIPLAIIILKTAKDYEGLRTTGNLSYFLTKEKTWRKIFVTCLTLGVVFFFCYAYGKTGIVRQSMYAVRNFYEADTHYENERIDEGIRSEDVKALAWLRDNVEPTAIVMSDKAVIENNEHFYYYGIFCERQQYMEGVDMLLLLKSKIGNTIEYRRQLIHDIYNNLPGAVDKAKAEGVGYIVQTVDVTPQFQADVDKLELVSSSNTINVYKVR